MALGSDRMLKSVAYAAKSHARRRQLKCGSVARRPPLEFFLRSFCSDRRRSSGGFALTVSGCATSAPRRGCLPTDKWATHQLVGRFGPAAARSENLTPLRTATRGFSGFCVAVVRGEVTAATERVDLSLHCHLS
jgi:hypothetical protein